MPQTVPAGKLSLNSSGIFCDGERGTVSEELNRAFAISTARPGAMKLIAVPEMVWSALSLTVASACSAPNSAPARPPHRKENHGMPV